MQGHETRDGRPGSSATVTVLSALTRNWQAELEGAATYRALAELEHDPHRAAVLQRLAAAEERHASRWATRIGELGGHLPADFHPTVPGDLLATAQTDLTAALRHLEADEDAHIRAYEAQARTLGDAASAQLIQQLVRDEASHGRSLRALTGAAADPQARLDRIVGRERWHVSAGKWISDAIYGLNDGLTAVFGIVAGVAAYSSRTELVVVAGMSGLLASALSMGASGYLASKSQREVLEAELARERREIEESPDEEAEELALFYQLKGFPEADATQLAHRLAERPEQMLRVLAQEELGLSADQLPSPVRSGLSATLSTAVGALIPVLPFLFLGGRTALVVSAVVSIVAHFAVGAAKSVVTLRSWWKSGLEMTAVAVLVALATHALGTLFGGAGAG